MEKVVTSEINAKIFKEMIHAGQSILNHQAEYVNSLNVFPVPDGDTGTNMNLTFTSGYEAVKDLRTEHVGELTESLAKGTLMGARGNSGVILSQLFRGFMQQIKTVDTLDGKSLAKAFQGGVDSAYKAVMKPQEGTILTVAREAAEAGTEKANTTANVTEVMQVVYDAGQESLKNTPELLPVLKEVGVVDSGGQGLMFIYQGFLSVLKGEEIDYGVSNEAVENLDVKELAHQHEHVSSDAMSTEDIANPFCTEIMVRLDDSGDFEVFDYDEFRNRLDGLGDSLLVVADDEVAKVHVHTSHPGEVMSYGQKFGELIKIKVDNMREQHRELSESQHDETPKTSEKPSKFAVIAVASGSGLIDLFKNFGVSYVIEGGQTMNPSTQDFLQAIKEVNAENIILLPNNSNIFLAAKQAADNSEIPAQVVETRNISQGLNAMLGFNTINDLDENVESMTNELAAVKNGQVTYATRDTSFGSLEIKKGDFLGLVEGDVILSAKDKADTAIQTIEALFDEDSELLTVIYGEDVTEEEAEALAEAVEELNDEVEVEVVDGNTPVYSYTFSVE